MRPVTSSSGAPYGKAQGIDIRNSIRAPAFTCMDEVRTRRGGDATVLITLGIVLGMALAVHIIAVAMSA
jgi:hypothetical protein